MLLLAILTWQKVIFTCTGNLHVVGDALGMLQGAAKFKAKDPVINLMMMEAALVFAPYGRTLEAMHVWSEENTWADELSRYDEVQRIPEQLSGVKESPLYTHAFKILGTNGPPGPPRSRRASRRASTSTRASPA